MQRVTLEDRTLYRDDSWNTLCLPFDLELHDDIMLYGAYDLRVLTSRSFDPATSTLTLTFNNNNILPAGTPFILKWQDDGQGNITDPFFEYVTIPEDVHVRTTETTYVDFIGTFSPVLLTEDDSS